jgi:anaerobic ribonucleoside-triphosphate reductase
MPEFNSLKDLEKFLNDKIRKSLQSEVADVARETMSDHVMSDVYSKYQPTQYERTGDLYKDIRTTMVNNNTLEIRNEARDEESGRLIAPVVEYGVGYEWEESRIYNMQPFPRPFVENTAKELEKGKAKHALAEGLRKQGVDVT